MNTLFSSKAHWNGKDLPMLTVSMLKWSSTSPTFWKGSLSFLYEVFSIIRVEGRICVMLEAPSIERLPLLLQSRIQEHLTKRADKNLPSIKINLWCVYCKKRWHTKQTCWKLHKKPSSFGRNMVTVGCSSNNNIQLNLGKHFIKRIVLQGGLNLIVQTQLRNFKVYFPRWMKLI